MTYAFRNQLVQSTMCYGLFYSVKYAYYKTLILLLWLVKVYGNKYYKTPIVLTIKASESHTARSTKKTNTTEVIES